MSFPYSPSYDTTIETRTVVEKLPTRHLDHIDWEYPFLEEMRANPCMVVTDEKLVEMVEELKANLRLIEQNPDDAVVIQGDYEREVISVGMVSCWPYWQPRPTVTVVGAFGAETCDWRDLRSVRLKSAVLSKDTEDTGGEG